MGLAPDVRHARNPNLIIVRISGFGTRIEAMSGFAAKNGSGDRPPVLPPLALALALADMVSGLYGAYP